jgi:hypothetical protein
MSGDAEAEAVSRYIAERGVTRCPTAFAVPTQAARAAPTGFLSATKPPELAWAIRRLRKAGRRARCWKAFYYIGGERVTAEAVLAAVDELRAGKG